MKKISVFCVEILIIIQIFSISYAHSGRTDSNGGHNSSSGYHYHHGQPAHQHIDGVCPYKNNDTEIVKSTKTEVNSISEKKQNTVKTNITAIKEKEETLIWKNIVMVIIGFWWIIIPIIYWIVYWIYTCIEKIMFKKENITLEIKQENNKDKKIDTSVVKNDKKICPRCGGRLVIRDGRYGVFWGCSNYPKCTYTKNFKIR